MTLSEWYFLTTEDEMEAHVLNYGPLSVCLCASTWASYIGSVMNSCCDDIDHCVQAIGLNLDDNDYWIVSV